MKNSIPAKQEAASGGLKASAAVVIRSAYDGSRVRVGLCCTAEEDRTQQQYKDECDINVLMKRYEKTGILPVGRDSPPQYLDVSQIDFQGAMDQVAEVRGVFSQLDARTRARFENDPEQMVDFLADPANHGEAIEMGLMAKPKEMDDGSREAAARVGSVGQVGSAGEAGGAAGREAVGSDRGAASGAAVEQGGGSAGEARRAGQPAVGHRAT